MAYEKPLVSPTINNAFYFCPWEFKTATVSFFFKVIIDDIVRAIKTTNPSYLTYTVSSNDFKKVNGQSNSNGIWPRWHTGHFYNHYVEIWFCVNIKFCQFNHNQIIAESQETLLCILPTSCVFYDTGSFLW